MLQEESFRIKLGIPVNNLAWIHELCGNIIQLNWSVILKPLFLNCTRYEILLTVNWMSEIIKPIPCKDIILWSWLKKSIQLMSTSLRLIDFVIRRKFKNRTFTFEAGRRHVAVTDAPIAVTNLFRLPEKYESLNCSLKVLSIKA